MFRYIIIYMPTKTLLLLVAIAGIIGIIIISIVVTVIVTGNVLAKRGEEERPNSNYLLYVKNLNKFRCPKCDNELKLYLGKDNRTYYRCKNEKCDYMVDPETLIDTSKKN